MISNEHDTPTPETTSMSDSKTENTDSMSAQLQATKEQLVRTVADFDNFRRRTERERVEWVNIARATVLKKFLPLTDDIARALAAIPTDDAAKNATTDAMLDGFSLIQKNLLKALVDMGVEEINTTGVFNPELHEALMQVDNPSVPAGTIIQVFEKGYRMGDQIIRHSKVSVAK